MSSVAVEPTSADGRAPQHRYSARLEAPSPSLLGALVYGTDARAECRRLGDPRLVAVPLEVAEGSARVEAWHTEGPVATRELEGARTCTSREHFFGVLELPERDFGGPRGAAFEAYRRLVRIHRGGAYPYVWRIWNFLDAINLGAGDDERYRLFCLGRAEGMGDELDGYPAGSALGRRDGDRTLQVIWLAGRMPGRAVESPRQVSAYRYPRQYGPASPSFSRAMRLGRKLLISGTSSIVGHETVHAGDVRAQVRESIANLEAVIAAAGLGGAQPRAVKAYVRHAADAAVVAAEIAAARSGEPPGCVLLADICRADLVVELEAISGPVPARPDG